MTHKLFNIYKTTIDGDQCYSAGLPHYKSNFSRDTFISGILSYDYNLLENQLRISFKHQGDKYDPLTGEEPGKIHHEYPGVVVHKPYLSTYNACDTTALSLIALEFVLHMHKDRGEEIIDTYHSNIEKSLSYLDRHIKNNIFWEFPPGGKKHFSLRTTYWKDSIIPSVMGKIEPNYPVSFALVHFQVARSLLSAGRIMERNELLDLADKMFRKGIETFIKNDKFVVMIDQDEELAQVSSDELHALAYIPKKYKNLLPLDSILERSKEITTRAGIACTPKYISDKLSDKYHGYVIWIFEQAIINYGSKKFGLKKIARVTRRSIKYIKIGQELLTLIAGIRPHGDSKQLWSVAAKIYFSYRTSLRIKTIL